MPPNHQRFYVYLNYSELVQMNLEGTETKILLYGLEEQVIYSNYQHDSKLLSV